MEPKFEIENEYDSLREELSKGKQYVFERPLILISGSIALVQLTDTEYSIFLPLIIIILLYYNIWFTVNRTRSTARIVAYIHVILESNKYPWYGWETSLRYYRKWLKMKGINAHNIPIDNNLIFDNIGYYPFIFKIHVFFAIIVTIIIIIFSVNHWELCNYLTMIATIIGLAVFLTFAFKMKPSTIRPLIEQNIYIWTNVYENWNVLNSSK
jgi:hypothetical protein